MTALTISQQTHLAAVILVVVVVAIIALAVGYWMRDGR